MNDDIRSRVLTKTCPLCPATWLLWNPPTADQVIMLMLHMKRRHGRAR